MKFTINLDFDSDYERYTEEDFRNAIISQTAVEIRNLLNGCVYNADWNGNIKFNSLREDAIKEISKIVADKCLERVVETVTPKIESLLSAKLNGTIADAIFNKVYQHIDDKIKTDFNSILDSKVQSKLDKAVRGIIKDEMKNILKGI